MKILLFNGSPRKGWNTHQMLEAAAKGAGDAGAACMLYHLYDYTFQGCTSCFACKVKGEKCHGVCARKDALTPMLEAASGADAMIFAAPVYLHGASSQFRAFLERLLFPITTYMVDDSGKRVRYLGEKIVPTGLIFTMNNNEQIAGAREYDKLLGINQSLLETAYGYCEMLNAYDTMQFADYQRYNANLFDPAKKKDSRRTRFPGDLEAAYAMGKRLAQMAGDRSL